MLLKQVKTNVWTGSCVSNFGFYKTQYVARLDLVNEKYLLTYFRNDFDNRDTESRGAETAVQQ